MRVLLLLTLQGDKGLHLNSMRKERVVNFIIGGALLCLEKYKRVRQRKKSRAIASSTGLIGLLSR